MVGRVIGTERVFFNHLPLNRLLDLPCKVTATPGEGTNAQGMLVPFQTGIDCMFAVSVPDRAASDSTVDIRGGAFGERSLVPSFMTTMGVYTGTIGFNGTILGQGAPVTAVGANVPFTREAHRAVGFPLTTGRLSITVTDMSFSTSEMFVRTGVDARTPGGNGVVGMVTGSMTARDIAGGSYGQSWVTLEIPQPSAVAMSAAGFLALLGCHRLARRASN